MKSCKMSGRRASLLLASLLAGAGILSAADDATTTAVPQNSTANTVTADLSASEEIARLKTALAEQQKQLQALQQVLQNQQQLIEKAVGTSATAAAPAGPQRANLGTVASLSPVIPAPAPLPVSIASPRPQPPAGGGGNPCESAPDTNAVPPYLRLGSVCIVPVGFMDFTPFWRDKNAGSSMGSNFGSVPYNNTSAGNLSEFHMSLQNSRLGFRVDGDWKGTHFIGYNEFDFNGTSGATNLATSNGAIVPRLRLFWLDVRKGQWEFLAGQSWSMLTPNRVGISALPGDLFYTQVIDINYMAGLTWTRQPGARILWHPSDKLTFGFSVEQGDNYSGGSGGEGSITLPTALAGLVPGQLDQNTNIGTSGAGYLAAPAFTPDFIAKIAWDPSSRFHLDVTGVESNFKTTALSAPFISHTTNGGGIQFGMNGEIFKNFRLMTTNFWSDGDGRYLFGEAPNFIVRADGSLSPVHSGGTIDGFEARIKNYLLYGYYGGIYVGRNVAYDANGTTPIGWGYHGSANSQNRAIQELTFGFNKTMWSNPRYGAINFMGQYEWLERAPWYVATNSPKGTHDSTIYLDVRYTLPGSMPKF
jgi:hypothetical protein